MASTKHMGRYPNDPALAPDHIVETFKSGFPSRAPVPMEESEERLKEEDRVGHSGRMRREEE